MHFESADFLADVYAAYLNRVPTELLSLVIQENSITDRIKKFVHEIEDETVTLMFKMQEPVQVEEDLTHPTNYLPPDMPPDDLPF